MATVRRSLEFDSLPEVEKLHPNKNIEYQGLKRLLLLRPVIPEDVVSRKIQSQRDAELED